MSFDEQEKEIAVAREKYKRDFLKCAIEILGSGYLEEYYDQMICSELRWAFALGYREGAAK